MEAAIPNSKQTGRGETCAPFASLGIMLLSVIGSSLAKYKATMIQTEADYGTAADKRMEIAEHTRSGVPETMLQTIYARAKESSTRGAIQDKKAEEIVNLLTAHSVKRLPLTMV